MDLPAGSHGLDAGCGLGLITQRLAEAVAPGDHVTGLEPEVSPEDWSAYQRLCSPDSPDFLLKDLDYYACLTYTMFSGRVAG